MIPTYSSAQDRPIERFFASGFSMEPLILNGDEILVNIKPGAVKAGDILLYRSPRFHEPVAHRLIKIGKDGYLLRADSDPAVQEWCDSDSIIGRVEALRRGGHFKNLKNGAVFFSFTEMFRIFVSGMRDFIVHSAEPLITRLQGSGLYKKAARHFIRGPFEIVTKRSAEGDSGMIYVTAANRMAGRAELSWERADGKVTLWISSVGVRIRYRGAGIEALILEKAESLARETGAREISLSVEKGNRVAAGMYERRGFTITEPEWDGGKKIKMSKTTAD